MTRTLFIILIALFSSGVARGALLTNFSGSYARYQACTLALPASKCYKCYFDPEGISEGQVRAYVEAPDPGMGQLRFDLGSENGIKSTHPEYIVAPVGDPTITTALGRQRYEVILHFNATGEPPAGPVTIFEYHIHDALPLLGLADVEVGFEFDPGDFITAFDPGPPPSSTTFDHTQLSDVPLVLEIPEPGSIVSIGWGVALMGLAHVAYSRRPHMPGQPPFPILG